MSLRMMILRYDDLSSGRGAQGAILSNHVPQMAAVPSARWRTFRLLTRATIGVESTYPKPATGSGSSLPKAWLGHALGNQTIYGVTRVDSWGHCERTGYWQTKLSVLQLSTSGWYSHDDQFDT